MEEAKDPSAENGVESEANYEKQLSVFKSDTLRDVELFRAARSTWLTETKKETTDTNNNVPLNHSNIYNGRCRCLRRMHLKTTGLRVHFQTLRPKIFYTLRQKITSLAALEEKKKAKAELEKCLNDKEWVKTFQKDYLGSEAELQQKEKEKKRKSSKVECKQIKTSPCEKAIKKLKASSFQNKVIESCQCDDGKEVTVVIKGFCLCDKTSLNNIRFDRVREKYSKIPTAPLIPEEVNFPSAKNSLELYRKQFSQKSVKSIGKDQELGRTESKSFPKKISLDSYKKQHSKKSLKSIREEQEFDKSEVNFPSVKNSVELYKKQLSQKSVKSKRDVVEVDSSKDDSKKGVRFKLTEDIPKSVCKDSEKLKAGTAKDNGRNNEVELKLSNGKGTAESEKMEKISKAEKKDQKKSSLEKLHESELGLHVKSSEELKEKVILVIEGEDKFITQKPKAAEQDVKDGKKEESGITIIKTGATEQPKDNPKMDLKDSKRDEVSSNAILKPTAEPETKDEPTLKDKKMNEFKEEDEKMKYSVIRLNVAESQPGEPAEKAAKDFEEETKEISIGDTKWSKRNAMTLPKDQSKSKEQEEKEEKRLSFSEQSHVDDPSLLSLYKSKPEEASTLALTEEQYEKIKRNFDGHDTRKKDKIVKKTVVFSTRRKAE